MLAFVTLIAGIAWKRRRQNAARVIASIKTHRGASTTTSLPRAIVNPTYSVPFEAEADGGVSGSPIYDSALALVYVTAEGGGVEVSHGPAVENPTYAPTGPGDGAPLNRGGAVENPTYGQAPPTLPTVSHESHEVTDIDGTVLGQPVSSEAQLIQHWMSPARMSNAGTGVPNHLGMERDDQLYVIGHQPPRNSRRATDENGHAVVRVSAGHTYAIPMAAGSSA